MSHRQELEEAEQKKIDIGAAAQIMEANRRVFERECANAGIDPAWASPALLKTLERT